MRDVRSLRSGAGGVRLHHLPRTPARDAHQVALVPPARQPMVSERMAQLVRMDAAGAAPLDHLPDAILGQLPL